MKLLQIDDLRALAEHRQWPCISMYLPTHRMGKDTRENPIRMRNAVGGARERLTQAGYPKDEAAELLAPASDLITSRDFWLHQSEGLAVFVAPDLFQYFRLPLKFRDDVTVADHFSVKPLIPLFSQDGRFYILALSQKQIRFFEATRLAIHERTVPEMLKGIDDLRQFVEVEEHLQGHTMALTPGRANTNIIFHGQGSIGDKAQYKEDVIQYVKAVSEKLERYLGAETAPLVLAGVGYEQAFYRQVNGYHNLLTEGIAGNPDGLDEKQLHEAAWAIVEPQFAVGRQADLDLYRDFSRTDKTSDRLETILPAAYHGRVRTLFVRPEAKAWGRFDTDKLLVTTHDEPEEGDVDLLDVATVQVLQHDGMLYALKEEEMPARSPQAAIFRY